MRSTAFTGLLLLMAATACAQFSILPQVGFETAKTSINYNRLSSFSPLGSKGSIKANIRLDYRFRKGHGPFIGIATSPAPVAFVFAHPSNALNGFKAATGSMQWRLEAGYQFTSKPISLKKSSAHSKTQVENNTIRSFGCGQRIRSGCSRPANLTVRLQPSVGLAYIPVAKKDFSMQANAYQYNAGNWKTGLISGMGFEFGKGRERLLTLTVYYTLGFGSSDTKTITAIENSKPVTTSFSSRTAGWGMTVGVPFTLSKNKRSAAEMPRQKQNCRSRCESYRSRCIHHI